MHMRFYRCGQQREQSASTIEKMRDEAGRLCSPLKWSALSASIEIYGLPLTTERCSRVLWRNFRSLDESFPFTGVRLSNPYCLVFRLFSCRWIGRRPNCTFVPLLLEKTVDRRGDGSAGRIISSMFLHLCWHNSLRQYSISWVTCLACSLVVFAARKQGRLKAGRQAGRQTGRQE